MEALKIQNAIEEVCDKRHRYFIKQGLSENEAASRVVKYLNHLEEVHTNLPLFAFKPSVIRTIDILRGGYAINLSL